MDPDPQMNSVTWTGRAARRGDHGGSLHQRGGQAGIGWLIKVPVPNFRQSFRSEWKSTYFDWQRNIYHDIDEYTRMTAKIKITNQNFENRILILPALAKNQFKHIPIRFLKIFFMLIFYK